MEPVNSTIYIWSDDPVQLFVLGGSDIHDCRAVPPLHCRAVDDRMAIYLDAASISGLRESGYQMITYRSGGTEYVQPLRYVAWKAKNWGIAAILVMLVCWWVRRG